MIHNVPEPKISRNFTIDDIRKIRRWHYERMKDATAEERRAEAEENSRWFHEKLAKLPAN